MNFGKEPIVMSYVLCILLSYLIGTINPAYIFSKIRGFDIRQKGSGNAGASNVLIVLGKAWGILCAVLDIAKAMLAIHLCHMLFPSLAYGFAVSGVFCVIGHIFPFYMKFKGGKGLACIGGMILRYDPLVFLAMLLLEGVLVFVTNYICFVPMTAVILFPVIYGVMEKDLIGALILCVLIPVVFYKHKENLKRIKNGTELRFSYLWNKEKEIERLNLPQEENQ